MKNFNNYSLFYFIGLILLGLHFETTQAVVTSCYFGKTTPASLTLAKCTFPFNQYCTIIRTISTSNGNIPTYDATCDAFTSNLKEQTFVVGGAITSTVRTYSCNTDNCNSIQAIPASIMAPSNEAVTSCYSFQTGQQMETKLTCTFPQNQFCYMNKFTSTNGTMYSSGCSSICTKTDITEGNLAFSTTCCTTDNCNKMPVVSSSIRINFNKLFLALTVLTGFLFKQFKSF